MTLSKDSFRKVSLILTISLILFLETCIYDWLLELGAKFEDWFSLKNFDLANMLLLGLGGMGREIFEISACLSLDSLLVVVLFVDVLLN